MRYQVVHKRDRLTQKLSSHELLSEALKKLEELASVIYLIDQSSPNTSKTFINLMIHDIETDRFYDSEGRSYKEL